MKNSNDDFYIETLEGDDSFEGETDGSVLLFENEPLNEIRLIDEKGKSGRVEVMFVGEGTEPIIEIKSYRAERLKRLKEKTDENYENYWNVSQNVSYPFKITKKAPSLPKKKSINEKNKEKNKKKLTILHWNANGVVGKIENIKNMINEWDPDVVSINETKTNSTTENYLYLLSELGYVPLVKNRTTLEGKKETQGGGVAILFKDKLNPRPIIIRQDWKDKFELVGAEIGHGSNALTIFSWYIPPTQNVVDEDVMAFIESHNDYILVGDLNTRCSKFDTVTNSRGRSLEMIMGKSRGKFLNKPNMPTNFTHRNGHFSSSSTIDMVIANESLAEKCTKFTTLEISSISNENKSYYHLPVFVEFELLIKPKKSRISFHNSFLYEKANWVEYKKIIDDEMRNLGSEMSIENLNEKIETSLKNAAERFIPRAKEKIGRDTNFDKTIVEVLKTRNFWGRRFREYRDKFSAEKYLLFEKLSNEVISEFRLKKWSEFLKKQGPHPLSSVPFWKRINRLRSNKRQKKIESIVLNEILYENDVDKANIFADNLEKKFKNETNEFYNENHKNDIESFIASGGAENSFEKHEKHVKEFDMMELDRAFGSMNSKTSLDPNGLSNKLLKNTGPLVRDRILTLFNWCLKEGVIPVSWKHSVISMLLKNGQSPNEINSYRPISMTSCLARLFERLVLMRIQGHLDKNKIIIPAQSGFRKARQTKDNILTVIQTAQEGFNQNEKTLSVFFDITAAFDKVWHSGLIYKLYCMGIPYYILRIVCTFLSSRTFTVKVNGIHSRLCIIECGVPQGGVLSPTLFAIYINDIPMSRENGETVILFADNIAFLKRYKYKKANKILLDAKEIAQKEVQNYLDQLECWMGNWRLSLAPKKCSQITFSKARNNKNDEMSIKLYGEIIKSEINPKFLGIVFDNRLNFIANIVSVKKKVCDRLNLLKILSYDKNWRLNEIILVKMFKCLVLSVIDYAAVTMGALNNHSKNEILQNNALRIIFKKSLLDKTRNDILRDMARVKTVNDRQKNLMRDYYERALVTGNPLIEKMFLNYRIFKNRFNIGEDLAYSGGILDKNTLELIKKHNQLSLKNKEIYPTTLCQADKIIVNLILDSYDEISGGLG